MEHPLHGNLGQELNNCQQPIHRGGQRDELQTVHEQREKVTQGEEEVQEAEQPVAEQQCKYQVAVKSLQLLGTREQQGHGIDAPEEGQL